MPEPRCWVPYIPRERRRYRKQKSPSPFTSNLRVYIVAFHSHKRGLFLSFLFFSLLLLLSFSLFHFIILITLFSMVTGVILLLKSMMNWNILTMWKATKWNLPESKWTISKYHDYNISITFTSRATFYHDFFFLHSPLFILLIILSLFVVHLYLSFLSEFLK